MNTLDKLFSREIERRTGAHAVNIYIESNKRTRKRSRNLGSTALEASSQPSKNTTRITTKKDQASFFRRLDIRFPWLKLVIVCVIGALAILDLCDLTISRVYDPYNKIRIAPMSKHIRVSERVLEGKKLIALTFDDGPSNLTTPKLLDVLHEKDAPSTFFILGNMARSNPDIVKRAKKEGHTIASHTMYHQNLIRISKEAVMSDIGEANAVFNSIVGKNPTLTRPPYGNINDIVRVYAATPLILWSVDTLDWQSKDPNSIIAVAKSQVHDGAIILMHDIYPTTVEAVPRLIDELRKDNYEFVTVEELIKIRGAKLNTGVEYYNFRPN